MPILYRPRRLFSPTSDRIRRPRQSKEAEMRRFTKIIVTAGLAATALPATAVAGYDYHPRPGDYTLSTTRGTDLRSPDANDSARHLSGADVAKTTQAVDMRSPDARDTSAVTTFEPGVSSTSRAAEVVSGGFQWSDAGVGAAAALGLIALCGGTLLLVSSRRRTRHLPRSIG
jgi:hypothetical protein